MDSRLDKFRLENFSSQKGFSQEIVSKSHKKATNSKIVSCSKDIEAHHRSSYSIKSPSEKLYIQVKVKNPWTDPRRAVVDRGKINYGK